jgi:hypothetical protein
MMVKPARRLVFYKRRAFAWPQPDVEFHVLDCVYVPRDVPALLTLLEVASPLDLSPVAVVGGGAAPDRVRRAVVGAAPDQHVGAFVILRALGARAQPSGPELQFKHISHAFMAYEENAAGVTAHTVAAVSLYVIMHDAGTRP